MDSEPGSVAKTGRSTIMVSRPVPEAAYVLAVSVSMDDILKGVELETVYETTFDQPLRVIREDELIADRASTGCDN